MPFAGRAPAVPARASHATPASHHRPLPSQIQCLCDQSWGVATLCKISDAAQREPLFDCPLDTLLRMDVLSSKLNATAYGRGIDIREHSFLGSPSYPKEAQVREIFLLCMGLREGGNAESVTEGRDAP